MIHELKYCLLERWKDWGLPKMPKEPIQVIQSSHYSQRLTFFLFESGNPHPMAVAKSFRHKKNDMYTVKEFKKIEGIRNLLPPKMKSTLPKPFSLKVIENYSVAFYEAFGGETLLARSKKETGFFTTGRIDFILQGTADWLFSFQKSIKNGKSLETENCKIPLRILNQRIQNKNRLSSLLEAESFLEKQNSLPSHPAQGDFWMGNIFYTGKGIGVVDWEFFDTTDLPLFDLFFHRIHNRFRTLC